MKFYNNILKAVFAVVLLGAGYAEMNNMKVIKEVSISDVKYNHQDVDLPQFLGDNHVKKILAKVDKCFGDDDVKKQIEKYFNRNLYQLNGEVEVIDLKIERFSKSPLFLLYSSLKLDC